MARSVFGGVKDAEAAVETEHCLKILCLTCAATTEGKWAEPSLLRQSVSWTGSPLYLTNALIICMYGLLGLIDSTGCKLSRLLCSRGSN